MGRHRFAQIGGLLRQGVAIEVEFGTHSLEALLWVAETVEGSVYVPGSLHATSTGLGFCLANPPLRVGAFDSVAVAVDGRGIPPERVRFRKTDAAAWRRASDVGPPDPYVVAPGDSTEFGVEVPPGSIGRRATVRLELRSVAIPPLVWIEIADSVRPELP